MPPHRLLSDLGRIGAASFDLFKTSTDTSSPTHLFQHASGRLLINEPMDFACGAGGASNSAFLFGTGDGTTQALSATTGKFIEFRAKMTGTAGDNRLMYLRYYVHGSAGAGNSSECIRASTVVNANTTNAAAGSFGLEFLATAASSECSGQGSAVEGTLMIPNVASWAPTGTYSAGTFSIYSEGTSSDPAGMANLAVLRLLNAGDGTGGDDVDTDACVLSIEGFTSAGDMTKCVTSAGLGELNTGGTIGIRIKVDGAIYYIPAVATGSWN